ncbi:gamma-glutamyltransferase family protein [Acetobacter suratthaniensis]|uniref:Gamma-glutamyltransferase family protein n=1 Tax=Acetobacter suratthaniensis TaxID=1502841 RepID=A0ABS3LKR6_9PROT|nr:gamma-glutamyltransferase family protein [Acetobacter suratthaniensis]MBO1327717.1 gamma-glutamyltransferase family protein [Acetobacter suratthaniensis]MCX2565699.1 gamma-glutamyltransferase family protein [Acetobacter suratthaniensis]
MLHTPRSTRGMVTSPHHLASQSGLEVLRKGGTALEAVIATAATLSVVYPHMTGLGGDAFWLVAYPDGTTTVIDASGRAGQNVSQALYRAAGHDSVPWRGGLAANTMAGTVSGWQEARRQSARLAPCLPLETLFEEAIFYAEHGYPMSQSEALMLREKMPTLLASPQFRTAYDIPQVPKTGHIRRNPALARTLETLASNGLESFYEGSISRMLATGLTDAGSPLCAEDFASHTVRVTHPLHTDLPGARVYNAPPPTQGVASLAILKLFSLLDRPQAESFGYVHGLVEATKRAFLFRNQHVQDPDSMSEDCQAFLDDESRLRTLADSIDSHRAMPWPHPAQAGDTTWMGAVDSSGVVVSMIQSLYFEFGSGIFLSDTGLFWQNRGASFLLAPPDSPDGWNMLAPGKKPFHTLNPALARFADGRVMAYGTMGGEGQPQTQAALFTRYALYDTPLQQAISAPRWLLGRTWGDDSTALKVENNLDSSIRHQLAEAGHTVVEVEALSDLMGHAGALVHHKNGLLEGATDPRSDGAVAAF